MAKKPGEEMTKAATVILVLFALCGSLLGQESTSRHHSDLQRIEPLTEQEKSSLDAAYAKIAQAVAEKDRVEHEIAGAHKMTSQSWMEYSTWWLIDGDWIFYSSHSYQNYGGKR